MSTDPILLIGGSGFVGRWAARFLRVNAELMKFLGTFGSPREPDVAGRNG